MSRYLLFICVALQCIFTLNSARAQETISTMVANPFKKFRAYRNYTEGTNFTQERIRENPFRRINVSMSWKFGKLKGSIKKNERSINNDDTKKASN